VQCIKRKTRTREIGSVDSRSMWWSCNLGRRGDNSKGGDVCTTGESGRGRGGGATTGKMGDEDMAPMHTDMMGAWHGEGVQRGCPSQRGGSRLIRFESPRWRPKPIRLRFSFGLQEQPVVKRTPRSHTELVLDVLYMVGSRIS
jgi:hypothetical protein